MLKTYLFSALGLVFLFGNSNVYAQFEGRIVFDTYQVIENGAREQSDRFTMYITPDRILLRGDNSYDTFGSIQSDGILIRLDEEDFVFLNGEDTALRISRQDIASLMNMFGNGNTTSGVNPDEDISYELTGEQKTVAGYRTQGFIFRDEENPENYAVVWMTRDIGINWGMMPESWGNSGLDAFGDAFSLDLVFKEGYFPLLMEAYESGELTDVTEASEVAELDIADESVEVPSGVRVMSFQDYLFSRMSGN